VRPEGLLCLDTARRVGWSYAYPGDDVVFGSETMGPAGGSVGELLLPFEEWLLGRVVEFGPRYVCYLTPIRTSWDNTNRLQKLFGLAGVVDLVCERLREREGRNIQARQVEDATVCKFFTGKGRWGGTDKKKAAVMAVCKKYSWDTKGDHDAADSLALLTYAEHVLAPKLASKRFVFGAAA
jgi:hypothetical protein